MIYFWHSKQEDSNRSHYRGILFEQMLSDYLAARGYEVELRRRKHSSLEYDIEGRHRVDNRPVVGEAKAHESTIAAQDLTAFVGKLIPLVPKRPRLSGLFLATSALSPEADDYFAQLSDSQLPFSVERWTGCALEQELRDALSLPSREEAAALTASAVPVCLFDHVLHTDLGTFVAVVGRSDESAFPDRFALVDKQRKLVREAEFLDSLRLHVEALRELRSAVEAPDTAPQIPQRSAVLGLVLANDWLDYRRPASSAFFVGRQQQRQQVADHTNDTGGPSIIEVKARSGVGKSSLLAVLAEQWQSSGHRVELHDARDVHSATDVFAVIHRFTGFPVQHFEDVPASLARTSNELAGARAFFMIDQFESVLPNPDVFNAYEYLALAIARQMGPLTLIFARKDDLLTTYDDVRVSLSRLRQLATTVPLEDLGREEAAALLQAVSRAHPKLISKALLNSVLEFTKGFPWLIKRTLAHIVPMLRRGTTQKDLLSGGLQLEDLFEEEISSLDELERGYLQRIAATLPATYQSLLQKYEGDPVLPRMLDRLTERRILRLSGSTYDVYNDVFKEYLLYARLPESTFSFLLKQGPGSVMSAFRRLGGRRSLDVESVATELGRPVGSVHNLFRELRVLGLIERTSAGWQVPGVVRQYEHQERLGEFLRQSLMRNVAVTEFLSLLERVGSMRQADVRKYLQDQFAFAQASSKVWVAYARTFISWLKHLKFIRMDRGGTVYPLNADRDVLLRGLGNVDVSKRGFRPTDAPFVPTRRLRVYLETMELVHREKVVLRSGKRTRDDVLRGLRTFGAIEVVDGGLAVPIMEPEGFVAECRNRMSLTPYTLFWDYVRRGMAYPEAVRKAFGFGALSSVSLEAYGIMLVNWGKQLGFLEVRRYRRGRGRSARREGLQGSLFDPPLAPVIITP